MRGVCEKPVMISSGIIECAFISGCIQAQKIASSSSLSLLLPQINVIFSCHSMLSRPSSTRPESFVVLDIDECVCFAYD